MISVAKAVQLPDDVLHTEHEDVRVRCGPRSGLTMAVAIHRTVAGRSLGGCRMKPYAHAGDAVRDVERLARAMTFKAAAAGLAIGGGKGVIALPVDRPLSVPERRDALQDFAELVDSFGGRYVTAQDVGTCVGDITFMGRFTRWVAGHPVAEGGSGDPSPYTAHGVEVAIRASLPGQRLRGAKVVVVGLGHVGGALAQRLAGAGARLTVSDVDAGCRGLADRLRARWVEPAEALFVEADLLAPCALGGVLNEDTVARLRVPVVAGAANNQLADDSVAGVLRDRGILWAPDFVANAGGLIAVVHEHFGGGFDREEAEREIEAIGDTLAEVYRRARAGDGNTLTAAMALARERAAATQHRLAA
jgi:leucine dehydrogenase